MLESLKCEVIGLLAKCLPLLCEVVIVCIASSERLYSVERGVVFSRLYCPKSSVEVPCVGVLCGRVSENPSV